MLLLRPDEPLPDLDKVKWHLRRAYLASKPFAGVFFVPSLLVKSLHAEETSNRRFVNASPHADPGILLYYYGIPVQAWYKNYIYLQRIYN